MRIHCLQHVPFETPGYLEDYAAKHNLELECIHLFDNHPPPQIEDINFLVVLGGPMGVYDDKQFPWLVKEKECIKQTIDKGIPVLGICLGAQLIAEILGAKVVSGGPKEIGWFPVDTIAENQKSSFLEDIPDHFLALHWHGDTFDLPNQAKLLASTSVYPNQAFQYARNVLGLQFHFEMRVQDAERLCEHCSSEIITSDTVQDREAILSDPTRFSKANRIFATILDKMIASASE